MTALRKRPGIAAGAALGLGLAIVVAINSAGWIGRTFPGFLIMRNRVVASVTLDGWLAGDPARLFQNEVVAVDGEPVTSSAAAYALVERRAPGAAIAYTLRTPDGATHDEVVPARRFSGWDYLRLFAGYLFTGATFVAIGLAVFFLKPESAAARGLLSAGLGVGLYALTGADLYGPHWLFRLHVAAETMASAGLIHLALVFPTDRLRGRTSVALVYAPFLVLAVIYELVLSSPPHYTTAHLAALSAQGLGAGAMIVSTAWAFVSESSPLIRRRVGVVALGAFAGFLVPAVIAAASALIGGGVPVNLAAFTAFLFPVSVGYAILRRDLFEIDTVLRHAISYVAAALAIGLVYAFATLLAGLLVPASELVAHAPVVVGVVNLVLVFLVVPLRTRTQAAVDRLFSRHAYDTPEALAELSAALAAVESIDAVAAAADVTIAKTLAATRSELRLFENHGGFTRAGGADDTPAEVVLPDEFVGRFRAGDVIARYEWEDGSGRPVPAVWATLAAELMLPIREARGFVGILVLGRRQSGRSYAAADVAFLRTVASQMALGIEDARLLRRLEQRQASLMRADRLATLGRLTAGVAHELGGPIGALLSSLKVLDQLGQEYAASIDEPTVTRENHHEIAAEMIDTARKATDWAERASAFLKRITRQSRESVTASRQRFAVAAVITETGALLAHRLEAAKATLDVAGDTDPVTALGDPTSLGQVLANLVGNALDAYEDAARSEPRILVGIARRDRKIVLTVRDWAGGMSDHVLARIFDELYTTKEIGRGTGLGLWISRNLIEQNFGGTLHAESELGVGSTFTVTLPLAEEEAPPVSEPRAPAARRVA